MFVRLLERRVELLGLWVMFLTSTRPDVPGDIVAGIEDELRGIAWVMRPRLFS